MNESCIFKGNLWQDLDIYQMVHAVERRRCMCSADRYNSGSPNAIVSSTMRQFQDAPHVYTTGSVWRP